MKSYKRFVFETFFFDSSSKKLSLNYSFDGEIHFTETFVFDFDFIDKIDLEALNRAFFGLWIMCGISYFKASLPPQIQIKNYTLSSDQKLFFEKIYTLGLGEFFYTNNIDFRGKVNFINSNTHQTKEKSIPLENTGNLVLVGGGKDSITTAEILKSQAEDFETLTVGDYAFFPKMVQEIGKPHNIIHRTLSPNLFELNAQGALNGHIPISSILAFTSVVSALLRGKTNILLSNEQSANEPNIVLDSGMKINHQYSKSLEFEKDFQEYVSQYIHSDIHYFSFLRPFSELKIAEIFCTQFFEKYKDSFASCNKNFKITNPSTSFHWCGECPKCAFVALLFSPFLSRTDIQGLFHKDIFTDARIQKTFQELLGKSGIKPFECVGEIKEVQQAVFMASQKDDFTDLESLGVSNPSFDWEKMGSHSMPKYFYDLLQKYLQSFKNHES